MKTPAPQKPWSARAPKLRLELAHDPDSDRTMPCLTSPGSFPLTLASVSVWVAEGEEQYALPAEFAQPKKTPRGGMLLQGSAADSPRQVRFEISIEISQQRKGEPWCEAGVRAKNLSGRALDCAVEVLFVVPSPEIPRWMIPGMFYKDNGYGATARTFPRFSPEVQEPEQFVSSYWSFRADRCATPAVFAQIDTYSYFLSTDERFSHGESSVGFAYEMLGEGDAAAALVLHFPWREIPVQYAPHNPSHLDGEVGYVELAHGEETEAALRAGIVEDRDNYGFAPILRALYKRSRALEETAPWMGTADAAELAADGLYSWFFDPGERVLYETCSFDKYFAQARGMTGYVDRPHMHISWVSGIPYAHALARWGEEHGVEEYLLAGNAVIDRICTEGLAPCGAFWGQWTREEGWNGGWNPKSEWLHARTLGEACRFLCDALAYESSRGRRRPVWRKALASCLDFALKIQRSDGCFGTYYDANTGVVEEWSGAAGLAWIPALTRAAALLKKKSYLAAARRAGEYYRAHLDDAYFFGACEDVHLSPSSEDGYNALQAYAALYEASGGESFLFDARRAAEWMLSFRWMYNTRFARHTILADYDFHTLGGDVASPPNQHLHNYGLVAHEALVKLWMWTGDRYYYERARDHLHYALQMIARADGDMNARRGMMSEQWYHTDWWQPKGCMLQLAHVWCAGFLIVVHQAQRALLEGAGAKHAAMLRQMDPSAAAAKRAARR